MTQQFLDDTRTGAEKGDWKKIDAYCRENISLIRAADQSETKTEGNTVSLEQSLHYLAIARAKLRSQYGETTMLSPIMDTYVLPAN